MRRITWLLAAAVLVAGPALAATPKDTVVMAKQIDDIISLDPAESFEFSGSEVVGNVYERLIALDLKDVSKLKGELAESWAVGADGKTYTFKMRKGMKFHSGNPVTAQDAAYSLQRAVILNKTPGLHPDPVRLHQGERQGEDPGDRRPDAGHRDRRSRWRRRSSTTA